jgi:peptide/nickel transport system substrate-binding protein
VATRETAIGNSSPVPLASPFSKAAQQLRIRRDLHRARALARAAGYKGEPITLIASRAPPEMFDAAIIVQAMARQAGINFEIVSLDWATHLARYSSGNYQAMVFGYSARLDPSLMYGAFTGDKAQDPRKVWGTPGALALLRRSQEEGDPARRQLIFDEMERLFRQEAPAVMLYNSRRLAAVRMEVSDYRIWSAQLIRLWNVSVERD